MKLKIVFCEPQDAAPAAAADELLIVCNTPYKITQTEIGADRDITKVSDGSKISYEAYCAEMNRFILAKIRASNIPKDKTFDQITLDGFKQPPNFKSVCEALEKASITCAKKTQITVKNSYFGGALYVDATARLINSLKSPPNNTVRLSLEDPNLKPGLKQGEKMLSAHDEARLSLLRGVSLFKEPGRSASVRPFIDDTLINNKSKNTQIPTKHFRDDSTIGRKTTKLENPTYFYKNACRNKTTIAESVLSEFFSQAAQQQSDYTCGPATLKMVANYYTTISPRSFCNAPLSNPEIWGQLDTSAEMAVAAQSKTLEAGGSDLVEMRKGLLEKNLTCIDDNGISTQSHTAAELEAHKEILWDKMKEILKLGIPIILNMQDKTGCGHFEVVTAIETLADGKEQIILAEPGTALVGTLNFEQIEKNTFIDRWKNMSGEIHGRFMVIPPNKPAADAVEAILKTVPHCLNGVDMHRASKASDGPRLTL